MWVGRGSTSAKHSAWARKPTDKISFSRKVHLPGLFEQPARLAEERAGFTIGSILKGHRRPEGASSSFRTVPCYLMQLIEMKPGALGTWG